MTQSVVVSSCITRRYGPCSPESLKQRFINNSLFFIEPGNTYNSVCAGGYVTKDLIIEDGIFAHEHLARAWIKKTAPKDKMLVAAKVIDKSSIDTKSFDLEIRAISFQVGIIEADLYGYKVDYYKDHLMSNAIFDRVKSGKLRFRRCSECDSKISVDYLKGLNCPVCNHSKFIFSANDFVQERKFIKRLKKLFNKRLDIEIEKCKFVTKKLRKINNEWLWLVGGRRLN
ncbi:MAG: hypothetical protein JKY54_00715 [Flavobacteriales bacterium]|nr:hypothetical protein [Flavobacteriales bacterium]